MAVRELGRGYIQILAKNLHWDLGGRNATPGLAPEPHIFSVNAGPSPLGMLFVHSKLGFLSSHYSA